MAFGVAWGRVFFWAGLAGAIAIGQMTGLLGAAPAPKVAGTTSENNVMQVERADRLMLDAQKAARANLYTFLGKAGKNPPATWEAPSIKVALEGTDQVEHIWVSDFRRMGFDKFTGKLNNDPVNLAGLKAGDPVDFKTDQISDWGFVDGGRGYGFYSVRAMLPMMEEAQATGVRAFLSADPLPEGW